MPPVKNVGKARLAQLARGAFMVSVGRLRACGSLRPSPLDLQVMLRYPLLEITARCASGITKVTKVREL